MASLPAKQWTLDTVRERCHIVGDCWVWPHAVNNTGHPQACINGKSGQMVRKFVFLQTGRSLRKGYVLTATCGDKRCCSPVCLAGKARSAVLAENYRAGKTAAPRGHFTLGNVKLSYEIAREIRLSDEPGTVLAEKHGVHPDTIYRIRKGRYWRLPANSVFEWRPAA